MKVSRKAQTYRPKKASKKLLKMEDLLDALRFLQQFIDFEIDSDEIETARTTGGSFRLGLAAGGGSTTAPLFVSASGVVTPGTIAGVMPTISGTALDAGAPALSFSGSGLEYVVANVSGTHTIIGGTFATNLTSRSVTITVSSTSPGSAGITSVPSGTAFRILIATFNNGAKTSQTATRSLTCNFYDDASGTAKLNCEVLF